MGGSRAAEGPPQIPDPQDQHHLHHHYYYPANNPNDGGGGADYVLLLPYHRRRRYSSFLRICHWISCILIPVAVLSLAAFLLWPSDPDVQVVRLRLDRFRVSSAKPFPSVDISLDLTVRVKNRDFFSLRYRSLFVSIGYRGRQLGYVTSDVGRIPARGSSYLNATLVLDGVEVLHDVFYLLEDMAKGSIPFDTVTDFNGWIRFFLIDIPLQARVSCEVLVNTDKQTIIRQDCYPE